MALETKRGVAGQKSGAPDEVEISGAILLGVDDTQEYYANHVEVGHSIHEFQLTCARIPGRLSEEHKKFVRDNRKLPAEALLRVSIPPTLIDDLIKVLVIQKEKFKNTRASIRE